MARKTTGNTITSQQENRSLDCACRGAGCARSSQECARRPTQVPAGPCRLFRSISKKRFAAAPTNSTCSAQATGERQERTAPGLADCGARDPFAPRQIGTPHARRRAASAALEICRRARRSSYAERYCRPAVERSRRDATPLRMTCALATLTAARPEPAPASPVRAEFQRHPTRRPEPSPGKRKSIIC